MKDYTSYFIGIPLPPELYKEYEKLLQKVSILAPDLELVSPNTPHITVYYLAKFPKLIISNLKSQLQKEVGILANSHVVVGELGVFGGENLKTIFLDTQCPEKLKQFREKISKIFVKNAAQDNFMPFYPHMTVASVRKRISKEEFANTQIKLKELLNAISWKFPITELAIYGVDSTQSPEYQKKLAVIPIN